MTYGKHLDSKINVSVSVAAYFCYFRGEQEKNHVAFSRDIIALGAYC